MKRTRIFALVICALAIVCATALAQQKADPQAYALLKAAHDARQVWPANFPGFTSQVSFDDNGRAFKGSISYTPAKGVEMKVAGLDEQAGDWLREQLNSLLAHRRGGDFATRDGRHPITFGEDDKSPLGRLVCLNDSMKSCYRVRNGQTSQVNRAIGDERFTIDVLETTAVEGGKYLPRHFTVTYFDAKSGDLKRADAFTDSHVKVEGIWMPSSRRVVRAENGRVTARVIEIHDPRILAGESAARN
jgi:hypothetical protein